MNSAALLELRDIHAPPPPEFWPPAPGWWLLALLLSMAAVICNRLFFRYYRRRRRRRVALRMLDKLRKVSTADQRAFAAELSILLRQVALSRFPRERVAGLSGVSWLQFLDETGGQGKFSNGPGSILTSAPYALGVEFDIASLYALARDWIKKNA